MKTRTDRLNETGASKLIGLNTPANRVQSSVKQININVKHLQIRHLLAEKKVKDKQSEQTERNTKDSASGSKKPTEVID